uniref:Uncharacterized protein n=1 Tax=Arundo donax TaxID=35708 RepID=A0A0A8Z3B9_ARUDO
MVVSKMSQSTVSIFHNRRISCLEKEKKELGARTTALFSWKQGDCWLLANGITYAHIKLMNNVESRSEKGEEK